jgi:Domain of unknown function (DUF4194)
MDEIEKLTDSERDRLRIALTTLFTESFLVRGIEHHAASYRFVTSNFTLVEKYLAVAGWGIRRDETLGVVAFQGPPLARHTLSKDESLLLLILRLLFEEKAGEISLHEERTVRQQDIVEKYRVLADATWKKTRYLAMLRRFQALRLIRIVGSESDPEATVILYPSIPFALDGMAVEEAAARIQEAAGMGQSQADPNGDGEQTED